MQQLADLARAIDAATDAGDELLLRKLNDDCQDRLATATDEERVHLRYYQSNTYAAIIASNHGNADRTWSWKQPDGVQNILLLRHAIAEPAFRTVHPIFASQIRTNLANRLHALGRPVAANEQWLEALKTTPSLAKAHANRAQGLALYGGALYDPGHTLLLLAAARSSFDDALHDGALWESGDRESATPRMIEQRTQVAAFLARVGYDQDSDPTRWSLGSTNEERQYRRWCLQERLFLNPLNEAYTDAVAATDVLHLPDHTYRIEEEPRFPAYYNLMKQEYISARYRLYCAIHSEDLEFLMRDVLMLDSGEGQLLGHYTEDFRSAFRSAYALFDKIGLFLNDYFRIGIKPRDVTFRRIWFEQPNSTPSTVRPIFDNRQNWPLLGLYFLSKDLFDQEFNEVAEPDADDLAQLRQQLEHRFLSLQDVVTEASAEIHRFISIEGFKSKTLRLLKMAREALIYVSLAMHREETLKGQETENDGTLIPRFSPRPSDQIRKPKAP